MRASLLLALVAALGIRAPADAQQAMTLRMDRNVGPEKAAVATGGGGLVAAYQTTVSAAGGFASSVTFSATPTGTASSDRIVELDIAAYGGGSGISGVTSAGGCGTGVTWILAKNDGGSTVNVASYYANVTAGTTCDITVAGNAINGMVMSVRTIHGQSGGGSATPVSANTTYTATTGGDPPGATATATVPSGGVDFAFAYNGFYPSFAGCTASGATYNGYGGPVGGNNIFGCAATVTSTGTVSISGAGDMSYGGGMIIVSWGP